ncbi:hypothetical protein CYMTET_11145 [Cymbomonas tetramitiformis]|uniref:Uncharacterized protein n=1 Tax=Cymbomonas tetramitiformis TaxID=36881 RepID=A0AAE0GP96_9CHLO|nr:hypothetical protein CYMTET_11145 [Cymbomonas tetramitiformis]
MPRSMGSGENPPEQVNFRWQFTREGNVCVGGAAEIANRVGARRVFWSAYDSIGVSTVCEALPLGRLPFWIANV